LVVNDLASGAGFLAAMIAVCGFLGQAWPALTQKDDQTVREATVVGGLFGLFAAVVVVIGTMR
jgi:purine-cytosine permease-like protein